MTTEQAGVPQASAVAQQIHHETTAVRRPQEAHSSRLTAAAAALVPDRSTVSAIGNVMSCLLRPYPIDDADPRATRRRIATAGASGVVAVSVSIAMAWRARGREAPMQARHPKAADPIDAVKIGVAAGAAGTAVMTAAQMAYYKATGSQPSNAPVQVVRRIANGVLHRDLPPPQGGVDTVLNNAMHWIYGTSWGALFGLAAAGRRPGAGIAFGLVVWGASLVHLPAMKLAPPVWEQDPETIAPDVGFHLLYGTATAAAYHALR